MPATNHALLADQFANARDGLTLVAIVPAGIPVTTLNIETDAQQEKELPLLTESTLRLIGAGVTAPEDISGLLGFPDEPVRRTLTEGMVSGHVRLDPNSDPGSERVRLTPQGRHVAQEHAAVRPTRERMRFYYDGTLGDIQPYDPGLLIRSVQADAEDLLKLPAASTAPVHVDDITPEKLNSLLRADPDNPFTVLGIRTIQHPPTPRYLPVEVLVYADADRKDVQVAVVVDGKLSTAHDLALIGLGGADALGIRVDPPAERPRLEDELELVRVPVDPTRSGIHQASPLSQPGVDKSEQSQVAGVSVFEHPGLLQDALTLAEHRILIMSPWIRRNVVTDDFMNKLEGRVRRGVRVDIAYGFSRTDQKNDAEAVKKLEDLAGRYPKAFFFTRLTGTHAKILIFDDVYVLTSFNWLSFQGDRNRTYRMEEGNLVRDQATADRQYTYLLAEIDRLRLP